MLCRIVSYRAVYKKTDIVRRWTLQTASWCQTDSPDSWYENWTAGKCQQDTADSERSVLSSRYHQSTELQSNNSSTSDNPITSHVHRRPKRRQPIIF